MTYRQYKVPFYGGFIGVITDTELYNRLQDYDAGLPLCEYGTVAEDVFLTTHGSQLKNIFKDRTIKFTAFMSDTFEGEEQFLSVLTSTAFKSVFTSSSLQFVSGPKELDTDIKTRELTSKKGATPPVIYTQETFFGQVITVRVDTVTPPVKYLMGSVQQNIEEEHTSLSILFGVIIQTDDQSEQLWLNVTLAYTTEDDYTYRIAQYRQSVTNIDASDVKNITDNAISESSDPYGEGDNPNPDGGDGNQDDETDEVEEPEPPDLSAVDTGFCSIYAPTKSQLNELSQYIWNEDWWDIVDSLKNMIINPMSAIMSLIIVPVTPDTSGLRNLKLGRWDTGIGMPPVTNQFTTVDCGELFIQPYYNTFLDYQPNTSIDIYLPFIGSRPLDPDVVTGRTVGVKYMFDVVTGFCVAFITVDGSVYYTFNGQSSITLPITQLTHANVVGSTLSALSTLVTMKQAPTAQAFQVPDLINSAVNAPKQNIDKAGNISGNVGYMANRTPFLTITRPNLIVNPEGGRQKLLGYPCEQFYRLGDLKGFTVVEDIQLKDIPAPQNVISDIENQLRRGVIL